MLRFTHRNETTQTSEKIMNLYTTFAMLDLFDKLNILEFVATKEEFYALLDKGDPDGAISFIEELVEISKNKS